MVQKIHLGAFLILALKWKDHKMRLGIVFRPYLKIPCGQYMQIISKYYADHVETCRFLFDDDMNFCINLLILEMNRLLLDVYTVFRMFSFHSNSPFFLFEISFTFCFFCLIFLRRVLKSLQIALLTDLTIRPTFDQTEK